MVSARSLRFRLVAAATVWVAVGIAIAFLLLSSIFRQHVTNGFDEELSVHAEELNRLFGVDGSGKPLLVSRFSDPRYEVPLSGYYWEVRDGKTPILASTSLEGRAIGPVPVDQDAKKVEHLHRFVGPTGAMFAMARVGVGLDGRSHQYIVGTDERHLEVAVGEFNRMLIVALLGFGAAMLLAAIGLVTFGLAPFSRLADALRDVRAGRTGSLEGGYPLEVSPLVDELNGLISHGRESLVKARAQAGNLAHALKSPLAIVTDEAFQLESRGESAPAKLIVDQCRTMQRHIDHHIARARAQSVARLPGLRADVTAVAGDVARALSRLYNQTNLEIETAIDSGLVAAIDSQDLAEIIGNLVDNACKFANSKIELTVHREPDGRVRLTVDDDGPGLPVEARGYVFEAGARLDECKPGSGLGLAIVRDLADLYGCTIELSAAPSGGLRVEVLLPGEKA